MLGLLIFSIYFLTAIRTYILVFVILVKYFTIQNLVTEVGDYGYDDETKIIFDILRDSAWVHNFFFFDSKFSGWAHRLQRICGHDAKRKCRPW